MGAVDSYEDSVCMFHRKIMNVAETVVGIDLDAEGIKKAKRSGINNIVWGNVENIDLESLYKLQPEFDIILAGEIIELLSNPGVFLDKIKELFSTRTQMIITTPNSFSLHRFFFSFFSRIEYVHPEHTSYYSYSTLANLIERHEFKINEATYYDLGRKFEKIFYRVFPHLATGLIFLVSYPNKDES